LVSADLWMREVNIHITTNNADYGDRLAQDAEVTAGDVLSYQDVNLADMFFKNSTAGSNTVVTAVGAVMSPARKKELGVE